MRKVRIACIQYQLRAIRNFEDFAHQVEFFVDSAEDYKADFVLLPELFTTQLMSFLPEADPVNAIRHLAEYTPQVKELFSSLAKKFNLHVIGGTHPTIRDGQLYNTCFVCYPDGQIHAQDKIHLTPTEQAYWRMAPGNELKVFDTDKGRIAVAVCYDSEFPELCRQYAEAGAEILFVPFCTDDKQAYLRVRNCAAARAVENQYFVAMTGTIGNLPRVSFMATNYGLGAILCPSDFPFARDAIAAVGDPGIESIVVADVDLDLLAENRLHGSARPFTDRRPEIYRTKVDAVGTSSRPKI